MKTICGIDCNICGFKTDCKGCLETDGRPFGGECVAASNYTVWWNGKPSAIKNENQFTKLCMAIFYPEK